MGQQYEHDGYRSGPLPTKKRQDPKIWITREGQRIPIATMGDNHLINARNMVKRSGAVGLSEFRDLCDAYLGGGGPNGEAAQDLFEYERIQFLDLGEEHENDFLQVINFEDLLMYIDNEPKLREILNEQSS